MAPIRNHGATNGERFYCDEEDCNSSFTRRSDLTRHAVIHMPEELLPFGCAFPGCKAKRNAQKSNIVTHYLSQHLQYRWECTIEGCEQTYADPSARSRHVTKIHGVKFGCKVQSDPAHSAYVVEYPAPKAAELKAAKQLKRALPYNSGMHTSVVRHINANSKTIKQDLQQFGTFKVESPIDYSLSPLPVPVLLSTPRDVDTLSDLSDLTEIPDFDYEPSLSPSSSTSPLPSTSSMPSTPVSHPEPLVVVGNVEPTTVMSMKYEDMEAEYVAACSPPKYRMDGAVVNLPHPQSTVSPAHLVPGLVHGLKWFMPASFSTDDFRALAAMQETFGAQSNYFDIPADVPELSGFSAPVINNCEVNVGSFGEACIEPMFFGSPAPEAYFDPSFYDASFNQPAPCAFPASQFDFQPQEPVFEYSNTDFHFDVPQTPMQMPVGDWNLNSFDIPGSEMPQPAPGPTELEFWVNFC